METALDELQLAPHLVTVLCVVLHSLTPLTFQNMKRVVSPGQQGATN